ncbi:MAG TPA: hypothetical protein VN929_03790 [Burkholderiales bacterium]|nr:hypothetical protein [Burkholderiales bacterium]
MSYLGILLLIVTGNVLSQEAHQTRELVGQLGSRSALMMLHAAKRADGGWRISGEYVLLPTLARRFLEGERSPELGVTSLNEGNTAILYGRPASGELRGTWHAGTFKGTRYAPGGQERERFEFSEEFPSMDGYNASVRCDAAEGRYQSNLVLSVESGKLKPGSFEWRAKVAPSGHTCVLRGLEQQPFKGGLRFASGRCSVTLREAGEFVRVAAENCTAQCGSEAYLEPLIVDRRGRCQLLHQELK